jgi:hypothetical protein
MMSLPKRSSPNLVPLTELTPPTIVSVPDSVLVTEPTPRSAVIPAVLLLL